MLQCLGSWRAELCSSSGSSTALQKTFHKPLSLLFQGAAAPHARLRVPKAFPLSWLWEPVELLLTCSLHLCGVRGEDIP